MMMKKRNLTICILLGVFSLILFSCAILINSNLVYVQASAENSELITNRNDFKNAVINANDGDTLLVGDIDFNLQATGDVNEGERITIDKSITIKNGKTNGDAIFTGASFILSGTKISGLQTSFTFENIVFDEKLDTNSLTLEDLKVVEPSKYPAKAQYAIECRGNTNATFTNCDFKNYMHNYGAAISAWYADYSSTTSLLEEHGNNAICELTLYLNDCNFDSNVAIRDGGAIYVDACSKNVSLFATNCQFDKNKSGVNEYESGGGAIYLQDAVSEFVGCTFTNNQANYLFGGECLINDTQSGGAVYCGENGEITVRNGTFAKNKASCGGAIAICGTTKAFLDECIITENSASPVSDNSDGNKGIGSNKGLGGAIYTDGRVSVSVNNTEICCNYAENALGAICNRYMPGISTNASFTLYFCTIADNECRFVRTDYLTYDNPAWIWYRYPGDVFGVPTVELFGCFIVDDTYEEDIPRHELPTEENDYNYFGSMQDAKDDGYILEQPSGHGYGHVLPRNTAVVSTELVKEKLGEKNYYGTFTVGANRNDVIFKFFVEEMLIHQETCESGVSPTIPLYEKTGYTLVTWRLAEDFDYQENRTFIVGNATQSVDLYAVFTPNTYTITYHFGEATQEVEQTYDAKLVPPTPQERSGYRFIGWYTQEDGKGDKLVVGSNYETASDITFYAYYEKEFSVFYVVISIVGVVLIISVAILAGFAIYRRKHPHMVPATDSGVPLPEEKVLPDTSMLSQREKEVLELLLQGKQRNEIATTLYISENTVKKNISSIYTKLNVSSRNELFALFK